MTHTESAWAKINLTLDILGKRPDGYHEMKMVMQSIDLCDNLELSEREAPGTAVSSTLPYLPRDGGNIAAKAAEVFFAHLGRPAPGLDIHIRKQIPSAPAWPGAAATPPPSSASSGGITPPPCPRRSWRLSPPRWAATCPTASGAARSWRGGRGRSSPICRPCRRAILPCASPPSPSPPRSSSPRCGPAVCTVTRTPPA